MEHTLWHLLHDLAGKNEGRPAFFDRRGEEKICVSYGAFLRDLERGVLRAAALPESRIGIWGGCSYSWIVAAYACMLAGKHVILFDNAIAREDFVHLADYSDTEALVVAEELAEDARAAVPGRAVYPFGLFQEDAAGDAAGQTPAAPEQDLIIFTSGTSASAKGVVISLQALTEHLRLFKHALPGNPEEVYFSPIPYFHIFGFLMVVEVLNRSGTFCISTGVRNLKTDLWVYAADNVSLVPSMIQFVLNSCGFPPATRAVITGGSACPVEYQERLRADGIVLYAMYGMSEAMGLIGTSEAGRELQRYRVTEGVRAEISPEGELWITLPCHFKEYYKKPAETQEILRGDTLMTGDLAELDAEGCLRLLGRLGDMIVLRNGEKINAADMDAALSALPGLAEAAVFGSDGFPVLAFMPAADFSEDRFQAALNQYNRGRPLDRRVSRTWNYGGPLPRTALGKIKRSRISADYRLRNSAAENNR